MSIHQVRQARKAKGKRMPIMDVPQTDVSGYRGIATRNGSVLRDPKPEPSRVRPFATTEGEYPFTGQSKPMESNGRPEALVMRHRKGMRP